MYIDVWNLYLYVIDIYEDRYCGLIYIKPLSLYSKTLYTTII
jgi:hypothetical protein